MTVTKTIEPVQTTVEEGGATLSVWSLRNTPSHPAGINILVSNGDMSYEFQLSIAELAGLFSEAVALAGQL